MQVKCSIEEVQLDGDSRSSPTVPGVCATCSKCNHQATAYGTGEKSRRRALVTLKEECPEDEQNYYVDEDDDPYLPDPVPKKWWEK